MIYDRVPRYGGVAMVKTKSVYDPVEDSDGDRIFITRYWPRGISKGRMSAEWVKDLAPNRELLDDWKKHRIDWREYTDRYHIEMLANVAAVAAVAKRAQEGIVTLLCFEREGDPHCHRHLLAKLIEERLRDLLPQSSTGSQEDGDQLIVCLECLGLGAHDDLHHTGLLRSDAIPRYHGTCSRQKHPAKSQTMDYC